MKLTKTHIIILGVLIAALFGAIFSYKMYNKPHVNILDADADVIVNSIKILDDFTSDETLANNQYLGKIIAIDGIISSKKIEDQKGILALKTNDDFGSVLCHLSVTSTKKLSQLEIGQNIKLKGVCTGFLMDVILVNCEIIN